MDDKKIISVPIDSSEFDAFVDKWNAWNKKLESMPDAWAGTAKGIKGSRKEFDAMEGAFGKLVKATKDPKIASTNNGFFSVVRKESQAIEKAWMGTTKELEKSGRILSALARGSLSFGGIGGLAGAALGLGGGLYAGTANAAGNVAQQYKSGRQLRLAMGKEQQFGISGKPYGLGRDQLEEAENAKEDVTQRLPFITAGISDTQFQTEDAADLAWDVAKNKAKMYSEWEQTSPEFALSQAQANGWKDDPDELRLLADAYKKGDLDKAQTVYESQWRSLGQDEATGQKATAFEQSQAQKWAEVQKQFDKDILILAPAIDRFTDAASKWLIKAMNDLTRALGGDPGPDPTSDAPTGSDASPAYNTPGGASPGGAGGLNANEVADNSPGAKPQGVTNTVATGFFGNLLTGIPKGIRAVADGYAGNHPMLADPNRDQDLSAYEKQYGLPTGILNAGEGIESTFGMSNIGPLTKDGWRAQGPWQFSPGDLKDYGVKDPFSEKEEGEAAARKLARLHKVFGNWKKAIVAYDWGEGNLQKDIDAHHDDWEAHIPQESKQYLLKESQLYGVKFDDVALAKEATKKPKPPDTIDGFSVVPFDDGPRTEAPANAADTGSTLGTYLGRLHDGLGMIGDSLREGGGSQFVMPPAKPVNSNQQAPVQVSLNLIQPAGSDIYISQGGIPS
jgi:hypothetical protein